jgi:hypothetical protein
MKPCMAKQSCVHINYQLASDRIPDRQHRDDDGTRPSRSILGRSAKRSTSPHPVLRLIP